MSVLIKGMEMPQTCFKCKLSRITPSIYAFCPLNEKCYPADETPPSDCPLIEVPPHGRLGDLDRLEQMFADIDNAPYSGFDGEEPFYSAEDAAQIIRLTPTVIPADKDGGT